MEINKLINDFSKTRPDAEVIVGYGSGVKKQANDLGLTKQIDLIFGVKDTKYWHLQNFEMNPTDYSRCGFKLLSCYENIGTKINYLTFLPYENNMFKIGVVSTNDLIDDLTNWKNFYLAGRFQKPIEIIRTTDAVNKAININRLNALKAALLLSKDFVISEYDLYETICSLSFIGDWRRVFHLENPNKISNIVKGSFSELRSIYHPLDIYSAYFHINGTGMLVPNNNEIFKSLDTLPIDLLYGIRKKIKLGKNSEDTKLMIQKTIIHYLNSINLKSSAAQPVKGLLINGVSKTKTYLKQKIDKSKI